MTMRKSVVSESMWGPALDSDADEFIDKAWEAETASVQLKWARRALDIDLDSIDGYILVSQHANTRGEQLALLREAVRVGDRLWGPHLKRKDMQWWGFVGTRPYMRAMHGLGLALMQAGELDEAEVMFKALLRLNPKDNQGIRELAGQVLLLGKRYEEFLKLAAKFKGDGLLSSNMGLLACALGMGNKDLALKRAERVRSINGHAMLMMRLALRRYARPSANSSPHAAWGSEEEASSYINSFWDIWAEENLRLLFLSIFAEPSRTYALHVEEGQKLH
jgi:tetratricopeptide (TPR) repeat protein